jgi:hypothetical protein
VETKTTREAPAVRAADVDRGVEGRVGDRSAHVDLCRQVKHHLGRRRRDPFGQRRRIADVELDQLGPRRQRAVEVLAPPGGEVVDHGHLVAPRQQRVDQIRADEAGAAGDQSLHTRADPMGIGESWLLGVAAAPCYPRRPKARTGPSHATDRH